MNNNKNGATYSSNTSITEDTTMSDKEYTSSNSEENAVSISKAEVTLDNVKVTKLVTLVVVIILTFMAQIQL